LPRLSPFELDRMILSAMRLRWRKVAFIVATVGQECEDRGIEIPYQEIADRIITLHRDGMINSQGDLTRWRHSEVCLKPEEGG
jgi:hypothetical protein